MRRTILMFAFSISAFALSACTSMSGLDANSSFACKAPPGVLCESMTGIYANAEQKNLPGQRVNMAKNDASTAGTSPEPQQSIANAALTKPIQSGTPIRSAPRILRVWFAPWEDSDGDLHDQAYVYLPVDFGRWLIEHNQQRIQDAYRPVRAPKTTTTSAQPTTLNTPINSTSPTQNQETIDAVQSRPSNQEAAEMLGGIQTPQQIEKF